MRSVTYRVHVPDVQSSAIEKIWYNDLTRELYGQYRGSQTVSGYGDVSPIAFKNLMEASSIGAHWDRHIKKGGYKGLNTKDVVFAYSPPAAGSQFAASVWKGTPAPVAQKRFRVTGKVLRPVEHTEVVYASSLAEAIEQYNAKFKDAKGEATGVVSL